MARLAASYAAVSAACLGLLSLATLAAAIPEDWQIMAMQWAIATVCVAAWLVWSHGRPRSRMGRFQEIVLGLVAASGCVLAPVAGAFVASELAVHAGLGDPIAYVFTGLGLSLLAGALVRQRPSHPVTLVVAASALSAVLFLLALVRLLLAEPVDRGFFAGFVVAVFMAAAITLSLVAAVFGWLASTSHFNALEGHQAHE